MPRQYNKRPAIIPIGPSIAYIPLTKGQYALIDSVDVAIARHAWLATRDSETKGFYAARRVYPSREYIFLHRELLGIDSPCTDHRNGRTLDCRRCNLRPSTYSQNAINQKIHADNKSGYKGVCQDRRRGTWNAELMIEGRRIRKSGFKSPEEASVVYQELAKAHHGEFMRNV